MVDLKSERNVFLVLLVTLVTPVLLLAEGACPRLVALAPSTTETLYALKLDSNISAVSRFAQYPAQVKEKQKVGSLHDVSIEALTRLHANPVVLLTEHGALTTKLDTLSIPHLTVDHRSITGIIESIERIGSYCAVPDWRKLKESLENEIHKFKSHYQSVSPVRTLIVVGESGGLGQRQSLYISGTDGYYQEALQIVGGKNAYTGMTGMMPTISIESLKRLDPEVIIQIAPGSEKAPMTLSDFKHLLPDVSAIQDSKIITFTADYTFTPGPRFPKLLRLLAVALHPDTIPPE